MNSSFLRTIVFLWGIQPYFNEITDDVMDKDLTKSTNYIVDRKKLRILIGQLEQMHESYVVVTKGVLKRTKLPRKRY